jgi:hypothetical protein
VLQKVSRNSPGNPLAGPCDRTIDPRSMPVKRDHDLAELPLTSTFPGEGTLLRSQLRAALVLLRISKECSPFGLLSTASPACASPDSRACPPRSSRGGGALVCTYERCRLSFVIVGFVLADVQVS